MVVLVYTLWMTYARFKFFFIYFSAWYAITRPRIGANITSITSRYTSIKIKKKLRGTQRNVGQRKMWNGGGTRNERRLWPSYWYPRTPSQKTRSDANEYFIQEILYILAREWRQWIFHLGDSLYFSAVTWCDANEYFIKENFYILARLHQINQTTFWFENHHQYCIVRHRI